MKFSFNRCYQVSRELIVIRQCRICQHITRQDPGRSMSTVKQNASEYCMDLVRKYDYENFLATLLLPKDIRSSAFAIRAMNVEVALVRDMVSQTAIGDMRMQFWKDAIDKIYLNQPPHQPVSLELSRILQGKQLTKQWFRRMIDARAQRMSNQAFENMEDLEKYSENVVSPVYYLLLQSIGLKNVTADHAASHCGKAQGITNVVRGIVFNVKQGRVLLPTDLLIKHSLSQEQVLRGQKPELLREVTFEMASAAHQHVEKARQMRKDLPPEAIVIFLPLVATHRYLEKLQKVDFNVFHPKLQRKDGFLPLRFWWHKLRKTY